MKALFRPIHDFLLSLPRRGALVCAVVTILWVYLVQDDPFFWDTVQLASKHAHHFYQHQLHPVPLEPDFDSGHPPLLGYYLACIWTLFGKSLPASHWAMAPFLFLNLWLAYRLGKRLSDSKLAWGFVLLLFADPVMAGQHTLVSPDVLVVCGLLLALEGVTGRRFVPLVTGVVLLCAGSMRGMMTAAAFLAWRIVLYCAPPQNRRRQSTELAREVLCFLPGFGLAIGFLAWHYQTSGWIGFHANSPWAPAFQRADLSGFLRNIAVLGWRFLDFGRFAEWLAPAILIWIWRSQNRHSESFLIRFKSIIPWGLLLLCLAVFLLPSALLYHNLSAHRYFLPVYIATHILFFKFILNFKSNIYYWIVVFSLATGNLWVYPRGISMDWDSTLLHRAYHPLRAEAINWMTAQHIPFESVGSAFPNLNTGENLRLDGDFRCFSEADFSKNAYIFASNIFNDFSRADYEVLKREWVLEKRFVRCGVWIEIYKRP